MGVDAKWQGGERERKRESSNEEDKEMVLEEYRNNEGL